MCIIPKVCRIGGNLPYGASEVKVSAVAYDNNTCSNPRKTWLSFADAEKSGEKETPA